MKTGHKPAPPRCALASLMAQDRDIEAIKRRAWQEDGILVVSIGDPMLDTADAYFVQQIGNRKFGRRTA